MKEGKGGAFRFSTTGERIDFEVGDALLFDSDLLLHGNEDFEPAIIEENGIKREGIRMMGAFVIHKTFLNIAQIYVEKK